MNDVIDSAEDPVHLPYTMMLLHAGRAVSSPQNYDRWLDNNDFRECPVHHNLTQYTVPVCLQSDGVSFICFRFAISSSWVVSCQPYH